MIDPQHLNIAFQVPGRGPCEVTVTIEPSQDPERDGQGLLGLYEDASVVKGFPLLHAAVKSLHSRIYGTLYGWVGPFRLVSSTLLRDIQIQAIYCSQARSD